MGTGTRGHRPAREPSRRSPAAEEVQCQRSPRTPPSLCRALQLEVHFPGTKANTTGTSLQEAAGQRALLLAPGPSPTWLGTGEPAVAQRERGAAAMALRTWNPPGSPTASSTPALRCRGMAGTAVPWGGRRGKPQQPPCPCHIHPLLPCPSPVGCSRGMPWIRVSPLPLAVVLLPLGTGCHLPPARTSPPAAAPRCPLEHSCPRWGLGAGGSPRVEVPHRGCTGHTDPHSVPSQQTCASVPPLPVGGPSGTPPALALPSSFLWHSHSPSALLGGL